MSEQDERRLGKAISNIILDIFGKYKMNTYKLERLIDKMIQKCEGEDDKVKNGRGHSNGANARNGTD